MLVRLLKYLKLLIVDYRRLVHCRLVLILVFAEEQKVKWSIVQLKIRKTWFLVKCRYLEIRLITSYSFDDFDQSDGIFLCDFFNSVRLCRRTITDDPTGPFEDYGLSQYSHYRGAMAVGDGEGSESQNVTL